MRRISLAARDRVLKMCGIGMCLLAGALASAAATRRIRYAGYLQDYDLAYDPARVPNYNMADVVWFSPNYQPDQPTRFQYGSSEDGPNRPNKQIGIASPESTPPAIAKQEDTKVAELRIRGRAAPSSGAAYDEISTPERLSLQTFDQSGLLPSCSRSGGTCFTSLNEIFDGHRLASITPALVTLSRCTIWHANYVPARCILQSYLPAFVESKWQRG